MGRREVNCAKRLPNSARLLNDDAKEELGWKKPFEIYYGRNWNVLRRANGDEVDFEKHEEQIKKLRNHAKRYSEKKTAVD